MSLNSICVTTVVNAALTKLFGNLCKAHHGQDVVPSCYSAPPSLLDEAEYKSWALLKRLEPRKLKDQANSGVWVEDIYAATHKTEKKTRVENT
jgi:hypothetical protein